MLRVNLAKYIGLDSDIKLSFRLRLSEINKTPPPRTALRLRLRLNRRLFTSSVFPSPIITFSFQLHYSPPFRMTLWRNHPGLVSFHRPLRSSRGGPCYRRLRLHHQPRILSWRQIQTRNEGGGGDAEKLSLSATCGWPPLSFSFASRHCRYTVREQVVQ